MTNRRLMQHLAVLLSFGALGTPSFGEQPLTPEEQQQQRLQDQQQREANQAAAAAAQAKVNSKQKPIEDLNKIMNPAGPAIDKGVGDIENGVGLDNKAARKIQRPGYNADGTRQHGPGPDPDKPKLDK